MRWLNSKQRVAAFMQKTERPLYGVENNLEVDEYNIVRQHGSRFMVENDKYNTVVLEKFVPQVALSLYFSSQSFCIVTKITSMKASFSLWE